MSRLEDLRFKYGFDGGKYDPKPDCEFCRGTGERKLRDGREHFCICLFVDHDMSDFAGKSLAETATKLIKELDQ